MNRQQEFRRAVERMKRADVLRKRDERDEQVASPVKTKQPEEMVTLGELMKQWPKRKG